MSAHAASNEHGGPGTVPAGETETYVLGACLHSSAAADVYHVHAADAGSSVAFPLVMKLAHAGAVDGSRFVQCEVEHQVLPRLRGVNVPRVVAASGPVQAPRLVMECVKGRSLQLWLDAAQRPGSDEVLRLGVALARAVHSVHRQHVVHHDLQPGHVLIRADGTAVLLGWGRAWHAHLPDLLKGLSAAEQMDASAWLAPEQLLSQRGDPRSDVYAIGVLLYQLLTGKLPFGAPRHTVTLRRRLWQLPVPLRRRNPGFTPWFETVVQRCLQSQADDRYPSAAHLAFDLLHPQAVTMPPSVFLRARHQVMHWWHGGLRALGMGDPPAPPPQPGEPGVPIVLLAIPPQALDQVQTGHLRQAVQRAVGPHPYARLLCVTVIPAAPESVQHARQDPTGTERRWLAHLRSWARPLGTPGREAACRVLTGDDAIALLLECAREHEVSDIVLNAHDWPAPVAHRLTETAPCSVLLLRPAAP